ERAAHIDDQRGPRERLRAHGATDQVPGDRSGAACDTDPHHPHGTPTPVCDPHPRCDSAILAPMTGAAVEPYSTGRLDVGDGHVLYHEEVGRPDGVPVVYLHGGPGSGCGTRVREDFAPDVHRGVLFDQRGAGRSTPYAA